MGEVFAAEDTLLARRVAVKFPSPEQYDEEHRARFLSEARAASRLDHPNIARIYDYGESPDGRPFLVMEFVSGTTLRDLLRQGAFSPARSLDVAESVLLALREAHRQGLVHRDIKPANIMVNDAGEVKVLDFGLAKQVDAGLSREITEAVTAPMGYSVIGVVRGTPEYMSPEQASGATVDERSDLFSLGAVLYECLTGRRAFSGSTGRQALERVIHAEPEPPSRIAPVPAALDRITTRALAKDPARRYRTADEMISDIRREGQRGPRRRMRLRIAAAVALLAAAAAFFFWPAAAYAPSAGALQWYQRGAMALRDGTYDSAAKSLEKAVELDPRFLLARARLAEARNELDDGEGAREEMLRAMPAAGARWSRGPDALHVRAIHATLAGDYPSAIAILQKLARRDAAPQDKSAALVDLGRALERNGEAEKATAAYRDAIRGDAQNAAARLRLAILLGRQRKPEAAAGFASAEALYQSQSNTEGQVEVLFQRGLQASADLRTLSEARAALEKAVVLSKAISTSHQEIAATLQLGVIDVLEGNTARGEEIAAATAARARRAGMVYLEARGLTDLGQAQTVKGDYARAEASLNEALATAGRRHHERAEARARFALGNLHQLQGASEQALRDVEPALSYFERGGYRVESMQCLTVMARARRDLGQDDEALAAFGRILSLARVIGDRAQMARAEAGIGSVLERQDRLPEALVHFDQSAAHAAPAGGRLAQSAFTSRGLILAELGRFREAEEALAQAEALAGDPGGAAIAAVAHQNRALLALFRGANREAAVLARGVAADPAARPADRVWVGCLAGVALARSGSAAAAKAACPPPQPGAAPSGISATSLQVFRAEILLANGEAAAAADAIRPALDTYGGKGFDESGWRVWILAARIYRQLGDENRGREALARAAAKFAAVRAAWRPSDWNSYLARPDIRALTADFRK